MLQPGSSMKVSRVRNQTTHVQTESSEYQQTQSGLHLIIHLSTLSTHLFSRFTSCNADLRIGNAAIL